ncbi:hypothetical protein [Catenuloplanes indicus]|uniref:Outer membrane protein assembly factor BamE (Lipoprotein component of BamABCDE complex) n=1 Tax=Catenuloplanes indicus TaxID=137267 RepID=A0AAE3W780_9ACTN|nr:hypothetical protein [Catenuloplanes indicus]MDQ0370911.1 outer membrane protein assembly factor BamE (lipoprotein component of BamABCDE complex) [Catenuloplanes indicus]
MITRRNRTLMILPFAALAALLLAGCPSSGDTSPEEIQRNPPAVSTPTPAAT